MSNKIVCIALYLYYSSFLPLTNLTFCIFHTASGLEAFATIAHQLLQDVQERLVFRAHLYLQSDIQNYNPSTGDLAYPEKLEMMEVTFCTPHFDYFFK